MRGRIFVSPVVIFALLIAILLIVTAWNYGPFADEFYYIECSKNMDFGYVDHPPLVALVALITRTLFGESYIWLRLVTALAGALSVILAVRITKKLGGGSFAQTLTALAVLAGPGFWAIFSFYSMNALDIVIISLATLTLIEILHGGSNRLWLVFGLVAGIGLQNKLTMLTFGFALLVGMLLTRSRSMFKSIWPFAGGAVAGVIFLPNILWQIAHGWPTMEFIRVTQQYSIYPQSAFGFLSQIILALNPFVFPLWIAGLLYLLLSNESKRSRALGILSLIFLLTYILQRSKVYYIFPIIPLLYASGSLVFERCCEKVKRNWLKPASIVLLVLTGLVLLPFGLPVLPIEYFVPYSRAIGLVRHVKLHRADRIDLPVHFALRFGWREMVENISTAFETLSHEERNACIIITNNYSKAGAINYYRAEYGLPTAISGHNNYRFWVPDSQQLKAAVVIGIDESFLRRYFRDVELFGIHSNPYAATWDDKQQIFICRDPIVEWSQIKPTLIWY
jgi:4-amino-4-deoxy-L-arabinose transferase-like glycosyltransferase